MDLQLFPKDILKVICFFLDGKTLQHFLCLNKKFYAFCYIDLFPYLRRAHNIEFVSNLKQLIWILDKKISNSDFYLFAKTKNLYPILASAIQFGARICFRETTIDYWSIDGGSHMRCPKMNIIHSPNLALQFSSINIWENIPQLTKCSNGVIFVSKSETKEDKPHVILEFIYEDNNIDYLKQIELKNISNLFDRFHGGNFEIATQEIPFTMVDLKKLIKKNYCLRITLNGSHLTFIRTKLDNSHYGKSKTIRIQETNLPEQTFLIKVDELKYIFNLTNPKTKLKLLLHNDFVQLKFDEYIFNFGCYIIIS